ncbi:(S)-8-oxocitronellyl enol synthase CYC2 [Gastrolobium bilobum]|uniref:(S)-8-oxocitronellyl enol synthase CYC2 n=1 Tax=Gastrolobium bilobum TaxID=150636 RepID=UPI002AB128D5|nr:(S)-8-oxocitronellyl enol synthase CYC2 [Gastrolobium bilobum]
MATLEETKNVAIIFGVTGLVGRELARKLLLESSWKVYGIARNPETPSTLIISPCYHFISCNLLNPLETQKKLCGLQDVTHVFWVTWASQFPLETQESCDHNRTMMSNALDSMLSVAKNLKHVSLQTGTKHYVSLQATFDEEKVHYYHEEFPRMSKAPNFYYALEDLLMEKLNGKVSWSVHRPGLLLGCSVRSFYNFMGSLCVYGAICKHLKLPFVFGGTRKCWEESYIDGSDARLVADQHIWAATKSDKLSTNGQAFNSINGPSFTWKEVWPIVGKKFGVQVPQDMFVENFWFTKAMAEKEGAWEEIVMENGLVQTSIENLANWEFLDALFRFPLKLLGSRNKIDELGFGARYKTLNSILYWIDCMRDEKLIP